LLADQFPSVAIITPEPKLELATPDSVSVRLIAQDDFGLTRATLFWTHKQFQDRFVALWEAFARRYHTDAGLCFSAWVQDH
jgi:hypothetical protein